MTSDKNADVEPDSVRTLDSSWMIHSLSWVSTVYSVRRFWLSGIPQECPIKFYDNIMYSVRSFLFINVRWCNVFLESLWLMLLQWTKYVPCPSCGTWNYNLHFHQQCYQRRGYPHSWPIFATAGGDVIAVLAMSIWAAPFFCGSVLTFIRNLYGGNLASKHWLASLLQLWLRCLIFQSPKFQTPPLRL